MLKRILGRVDQYQRRHPWLGFPFGVLKKFSDDKAGQLAALIAYYGFFSLFPLLLVLVTVLGLLLRGNPDLQQRILDSALAQFPIIGDQIRENIHSLRGSGLALGIGIGGALWAGLGGLKAAQNAMNKVWDVPIKRHPNLVTTLVRAAVMLVVLGVLVLASTLLAGLAAGGTEASVGLAVLGVVGSLAVNLMAFWIGFKVLTVEDVSWKDVFPGAVMAAVMWAGLQLVGSYYVGHQLKNASQVYGFFAVIIGLLSWIYLGAQVMLLAAEVNVVKARHLWPRSLVGDDLTETDERALRRFAKVEERRPEERVDVRFEDGDEAERQTRAPDRSRETR